MVPLHLRDAPEWGITANEGLACAGPIAKPNEIAVVSNSFEFDMAYSLGMFRSSLARQMWRVRDITPGRDPRLVCDNVA